MLNEHRAEGQLSLEVKNIYSVQQSLHPFNKYIVFSCIAAKVQHLLVLFSVTSLLGAIAGYFSIIA